jgi:adenine-specific DNA-methyltransferase
MPSRKAPPAAPAAPTADPTAGADAAIQATRHRAKRKNFPPVVLAAALRRHEPWLERVGKRERPWFEVEPPALHIHERVSTLAMLRVLAREDVNRDLFADPQQSYARAVQFYKNDVDWGNRRILGDSLTVMARLALRAQLSQRARALSVAVTRAAG